MNLNYKYIKTQELTVKLAHSPQWRHWRQSKAPLVMVKVNNETKTMNLVLLLLTLNKYPLTRFDIFIVNFEYICSIVQVSLLKTWKVVYRICY